MATALRSRPAPATAAPGRPPPPPEPTAAVALTAGVEVALVLVTVAAVVSLGRLFVDWSFFGRVLAAAVTAHVLAILCRRLHLGLGGATMVSAVGLVLVAGWVVEPHSLTLGLPLGKTWQTAATDLRQAADRFSTVVPPAPVLRGFVLASVVAVWIAAFVADAAAFRVGATFEAVIPSFTIFLFGSVLAQKRNWSSTSGLYLAAVLLFMLLLNAARREETAHWLAGRRSLGTSVLLRRGAVIATLALVVALVGGPHLPGARSAPVFNWRKVGAGEEPARKTISPFVQLGARFSPESRDIELFTVQSSSPDYWRLTSLDAFDGSTWTSEASYTPAKGRLPASVSSRAQAHHVVQTVDVSSLDTPWLPAAYRPVRLQGKQGVGAATFNADSSSLLVEGDRASGSTYVVDSELPHLTEGELQQSLPTRVAARYLDLPVDFPETVRRLAFQVTAGGTTQYDKALLLQNWFRDNFRYDERVNFGEGNGALLRFLQARRGFCQQFAGTYGAMARAIGLPARVAVGFTMGHPDDAGVLHVLNRDAHAWPEVYLAGYGWVRFEPTPGRGAPDEGYAHVPPMAIEPLPRAQTQTTDVPATTPSQSTPTSRAVPNNEPGATAPKHHHSHWARNVFVGAGVALGLLAAAVGAVLLVRRRRWHRRRQEATTPDRRVLVAWAEAEDSLSLAGLPRRPSETPFEYAARVPHPAGVPGEVLAALAADTATAAFSAEGVDGATAARAEAAAADVRAQLALKASRPERVLWALGFSSGETRSRRAWLKVRL
jgi:transglutaminase-like putative cysteine protease